MATKDYLPSPARKLSCQSLDDFLQLSWHQEIMSPSEDNVAATCQPDDFKLYSPSLLTHNIGDWSDLDALDFALPSPCSPVGSKLDSPIWDDSSTCARNSFYNKEIEPNSSCYNFYANPSLNSRPSSLVLHDLGSCINSGLECNLPKEGNGILSQERIQELYSIAMPSLTSSLSADSSPALSPASLASMESPESPESPASPAPEAEFKSQPRRQSNKRQSSVIPRALTTPKQKTSHNKIEKRYRCRLNSKIAALREKIPSLRDGEERTESDGDETKEPKKTINKATVLSKAVEYIVQLEKENARLIKECAHAQSKITSLERLVLGTKF